MRKSNTHLQKRYFMEALKNAKRARKKQKMPNTEQSHKTCKSAIFPEQTIMAQSYQEEHYHEVYFEILGFEQSSAMQIVSHYAKECHVDLKLANSMFAQDLQTKNISPIATHDILPTILSQEYGIIACATTQCLETFFKILESLFAERLLRGNIVAFALQKLRQYNYSLCVAESCTGGTLSAMITAINGASAIFKGGITTYSIESKQQILGIKDSIITEHGVYSEACVRAMARGVLDLFQADIAIATSGLATEDTSMHNFLHLPAGMVFTCVLIRDKLPISIAHNYLSCVDGIDYKDSRVFVQQAASLQALRLLLSVLES